MNLLSFIRSKHNLVFKLLLVVISSACISVLLPNRLTRGHKVDSFTAVWPYEDLVAEQDLVVKKENAEIEAEKERIRQTAPVFFEADNYEKDLKLRELELLKARNAKLYNVMRPYVDSIYKRGVLETPETDMSQREIYVSNGVYADQAVFADFFTVKSAAAYLEKIPAHIRQAEDPLKFLAINYKINRKQGETYVNSRLDQISVFKEVIRAGQVLVKQGEALTNKKRVLVNRYFSQLNEQQDFSVKRFLAKWLLTFILCTVLLVFLAFFRTSIFGQNKQVAFLFLLLVLSVLITAVFYRYDLIITALPFALVPILVRVFFDGRTALFTYLMIVLHCSIFMPDRLEFILLELVPGIGTLFAVAEMRKRQQILNAAMLVFVFYVLVFVSYRVGYGSAVSVQKITSYVPFAVSSMLVLLAYPLIYITERLFGFISDFKLLELCDLNQPLLRQLSKDIPGTFQHSLQVANLAEEAIFYVGGNSLLVRAGAMYHDIGKLENPYFFTENQANGFSPHQEMEPLESAKIIINHVILGVEMAKKNKLPEQVIDFIRTHHGTTPVSYFLHLYKKQTGQLVVDETPFRYSGPIPFSKETAVLMMADGVEAASRSLKKHDAVSINELVDNIIDYKIETNQFINSDITFKDITTIKKIFKKRLMNIYHARIEYPAQEV